MKDLKVWPHLSVVAILCALAAGVGVALWMKHERNVSADALPNAARIARVDGEVALNNGAANLTDEEWIAATPNQPFSVGDRIYTRQNSHAGLAFSGRNFARLSPNTSLDVLSLSDRRTQLALRDGSAMFDVGHLAPGEVFEVATPYGAVDLDQPGLYNIGMNNGNVIVSVLSGLAQVVGLEGSGQISKGEVLTLLGQTAANVILSRLNNDDAGYLLDDYYGYQYPQLYDGRYSDYNAYLNDPNYYDPYRRDPSYQYVSSYIPGINDLDYYGDWQNLSGYGYAWQPSVDSGWTPYRDGYWMTDYPYGPTWVSNEAWGYAPYHYGRWANVGNQWYWIPDSMRTTPTYSPALVAFVPLTQANEIGWVPLGPGDAYAPRYYDQNWQPHYLTRADVTPERVTNLYVPDAVTTLPFDDFARGMNHRRARRAERELLAQIHPTLDPLRVTSLRNAVTHSAWGRGKIDLPPGIRKKLDDTRVFTSEAPPSPRFRKDLARALRVESVPERVRNGKFKVKDERKREDDRSFNQISRGGFGSSRKEQSQQFQRLRDYQQQQRQIRIEQGRVRDSGRGRGEGLGRGEGFGRARSEGVNRARGERVAAPVREQPQRSVQVPLVRQQDRYAREQERLVRQQQRESQKAQRQELRRQETPRIQDPPKSNTDRSRRFKARREESRQATLERPSSPPKRVQQDQPQAKQERWQKQEAPRQKQEAKQGPPAKNGDGRGGKGKRP